MRQFAQNNSTRATAAAATGESRGGPLANLYFTPFVRVRALLLCRVWARYHCIVLFDEEYSGIVEREPLARARFYAAQKVIEEPFNLRTEQWVHSATVRRDNTAAAAAATAAQPRGMTREFSVSSCSRLSLLLAFLSVVCSGIAAIVLPFTIACAVWRTRRVPPRPARWDAKCACRKRDTRTKRCTSSRITVREHEHRQIARKAFSLTRATCVSCCTCRVRRAVQLE